ncbi:MAG TPA: NAD(P)/FAD-dependent oxidoreductase [Noviherbaspirillum sp.]|jgi:L-2-hydroxyglutarate oxidase LhgO|uniref:NAD(P)/FAD-dependent oxidoreductase n=1 Tax=Noviherbaspirillum sp. TaxID=1926288 RepID=UPI002DDD182E|nr:NAD(P)/FAD-dependent oxidoreductase [Noviherbaspirillum sp.]HEV2609267.1 NAD(P)/FAD-dependent oxidoreductase [Noviherbaspirillum sp.]
MDSVGCVVIGAGVVGLAVARILARAGLEVVVVESQASIGTETSSRNSEVIHAGLYYPTGSLKAKLCVQGRDALYAYCAERGIDHQRCGKLVVATSPAQITKLNAILAQAHANGCTEVTAITADAARALEPALSCVEALHSPNTGIVDSHAYMLSLQADAESAGAAFAFDSRIIAGSHLQDGIKLTVTSGDGDTTELHASTVVNCAGLWAPRIAGTIDGLDGTTIPTAYFAKGSYFALGCKAPFTRLIYPVPEEGGLGVHLTLDLGGQARFGPDIQWLDNCDDSEIDYRVDPSHAAAFYNEIRAYWPDLPDGSLQPAYAGVRPKISPPGAPAADFLFASHGSAHYLGLYGIESPGLTASLAIANHVASLLGMAADGHTI